MKKIFKEGDVVYDNYFGYGEGIVSIVDKSIVVKFKKQKLLIWYTLEGKRLGGGAMEFEISTLSFTPYTVEKKGFSQERPTIQQDMKPYINKLCVFSDDIKELNDIKKCRIGVLTEAEYMKEGYNYFTEETSFYYCRPLTPKEIKQLT